MRIPALIFCLMVAGCRSFESHAGAPTPSGTLFASIRLTRDAFNGEEKQRTGFFFYVNRRDGDQPTLTGYRYHHGKIALTDARDVFGAGSGDSTVAALRAVNLQPFDFKAEVQRCEAKLRAEAKAQGRQFFSPGALDGAEYEIVVMTDKGPLVIRGWNPRSTIDRYAAHSQKIAKLKVVLDILALYYGRLQFETPGV